MEAIHSFSLAKHDGPYEKWPLRTRLFRDDAPTDAEVPGYVIEAQYRCDAGFLLITSFDCPFEEANEFVLLAPDLSVLATEHLGVMYGSFLLNAHWPVSDRALRLHYYDRLFYTLAIEGTQSARLEKYRLTLTHDPEPESDPRSAASIADLRKRLDALK